VVIETRFRHIFAPRLHQRLAWFGRLRWFAVGGLALVSVLGPSLGFPSVWPSLCVIAGVVAAYNLVFQQVLRWAEGRSPSQVDLNLTAGCEMVMDLAALLATVHFTGGLQSPLLPFFAFHMAIGTIIISNRWAYLLAGATSIGALALLLMEARGLLRFHPLQPGSTIDLSQAALNLVALVVALFGIVYLTGSVATQLMRTSIGLSETAGILQQRSEELHRVVEEMADLERRKSHYMRISAHQLRSPLGTIRTSLQVLTDGFVDPSSERGRRLLNGAMERTDDLLATVNDLLELAKIREGRRRAPWRPTILLNQLLADLLDSLATAAGDRGIEMTPEFHGVAVLDWGVPPDLVHAFENLIYNAIKYSHPGGKVTVRLETSDECALVRISDRGIGIPENLLDDVFFEFVRAPNAKRHAAEGTGLGLAIVREVVEAHGGLVSVEAPAGQGTTFRVTLPLHHVPGDTERPLQAGNDRGYRSDTRSEPELPA
jgi:signal transduction histidine kinase